MLGKQKIISVMFVKKDTNHLKINVVNIFINNFLSKSKSCLNDGLAIKTVWIRMDTKYKFKSSR